MESLVLDVKTPKIGHRWGTTEEEPERAKNGNILTSFKYGQLTFFNFFLHQLRWRFFFPTNSTIG